jgi:hypothetical protein
VKLRLKLRRDYAETGAAVTETETETESSSYKSLAVQLELKGPCCDAASGHIHASTLSTHVRIRR